MYAIRCFSCNKVLGHLWLQWERRIANGEDKASVLDDMKVKRYCCRRMLLTNPDAMNLVSEFGDRHKPADITTKMNELEI